jgi:Membrane bound beta barrel domain (DUF5777)
MNNSLFCRMLMLSALLCLIVVFGKAQEITAPKEIASLKEIKSEETVKVEKPAKPEEKKLDETKPASIKVTFDETNPNIMIIESNGQKIRVDASKKTVEQLNELKTEIAQTTVAQPNTDVAAKKDDEKEDMYAYEEGDEPYIYRVVNVPTPKKVPKGTWNLNFSHRFSQPINPIKESGKLLLGFDSFSASSFGIMYGITDKFYISASRTPICQKGMCRTVELGLGYHITDQNKKSPLAVSVYASMEGNENFSKNYTYNLQAMLSRDIGKKLFLFFSPAVHLNTNGQKRFNPVATDYFPVATAAVAAFKLPAHAASFGFGAGYRIRPNVMALFDFTPRTGFKAGQVNPIFNADFEVIGFKNESQPAIGFGLQYNIGKHGFAFTASNTQSTTTSKYNSSNLVLSPKTLTVGFNLYRRW